MEPLERTLRSTEPEQVYKTLSKLEQFLVDAFSILAGIFTLSFGYKSAFRWAVSKLDSASTGSMSSTSTKTNQRALSEFQSPIAILSQKLGVSEDKLGSPVLILTDKKLTSLPSEIGNLSQLQSLNLFVNNLTSLAPEIGNLSQLQRLDLNYNRLTSLPPEIGNLSQLQRLDLNENQLTSLPPEIGNLSQLQILTIYQNTLTSLPPEIGNLFKLQLLDLNYNRLTSIPQEIGKLSQLQELWLNGNNLTQLPREIGDLTRLEKLSLENNRFTEIPECLFRLPRNCTIDLEGNPIPIERLRALQARVNAPAYNGPRFLFSIHEEVQATSTKTADEVIAEWGGDPEKLNDKENLKTWLQRQRDTKDYKDQPERVKNEIKNLLVWMGEISDPDIKEQAKLLISQGSATCGDRLTQSRNDLACVKKVAESGNLNINDLKDLVIGLHRLDLVRKAARTKLETMNARDDIETLLHFENALKAPLNLPISTTGMLYQGMSGVTPQDIESTKTAILSQTTSIEDQAQILIKNVVWKKRLDTHPDMSAIKAAIAKAKEDFGEVVSGEEAEYEKEFNRLEKEEWDPYLILTQKLLHTSEV